MVAIQEIIRKGSKNTFDYLPVPLTEDIKPWSGTDEARQESSKSSRYCRVVGIGILIGLTSLVALLIARQFALSQPKNGCGTTPAEARAKGCVFELTGSSWVHKDCYDPEVEAEFLAFKDWRFYKDINYTQVVPLEEVRQGEGPGYFVPHEYHGTHCGFLLKKLHRAVNSGRKLDGLISSIHHTSHCVQWMLDPPKEKYDRPQFAYTKFPYCGKEGGYNVDESHPHQWVNP